MMNTEYNLKIKIQNSRTWLCRILFNIPCQYATSTYESTFSSRNKQTNIFLISNGKGVIVKQETKQKRNETKQAETKRNETKRDTTETKQDKAETKPKE